jgi:membrane-bound serine protease (ClpP class)
VPRPSLRLSLLGAVLALALPAAAPGGPPRAIHRIVIDGTINPATSELLAKTLKAARDGNGEAVLIELDTPGGILESTQQMVRQILNSDLPVIVFVSPRGARAASAGTFILLAAHVAAMAPGTRVGAAHPVGAGGEDIGGDMRKKAENDTAAFIASIAKQRGRNAAWAVKAVRESTSITSDEALKLGVIDLVADGPEDLAARLDGRKVSTPRGERTLRSRGAPIVDHEMTLINRVIDTVSQPNIAVLLFLGGLLGLYMEFTHPGLIFPGIAGGLCLILFFVSAEVLPFNEAGFVLVALGIGLLVAELFVTSFGLLFLGGIVSLTLGLMLLFDTPESDLRVSFWSVLFPAMLALAIFGAVILVSVTRVMRTRQHAGVEAMVGSRGVARTEVSREQGKVFISGEWWNAVSEEPVSRGDPVIVTEVREMTLRVRPARREET